MIRRRTLAGLLAVALVVLPSIVRRAEPVPPPAGVTIAGVDAHDGMAYQDAGTYYLVGTKYGCGFNWGIVPTPWCGYSVFSAPALAGPWAFVRMLFPVTDVSPYNGTTWQHTCGDEGSGCFNPRMVKRPDGVWILWFNAVYDEVHFSANGYYAMGCNGPAGPCGTGAGAPYGSTHKPAVYRCRYSGDFSIVQDGADAWIVCNTNTYTLTTERLNSWYTDGVNVGGSVPGVTNAEGPGAFKADDGTWFMTFSDPACGYCAGTATSYAVAPALGGPWTWPANATSSGGDMAARRKVSANSCGGQPRTVVTLDGVVYQFIDLWHGGHGRPGWCVVGRRAPAVHLYVRRHR
jgi:hypothetical protein